MMFAFLHHGLRTGVGVMLALWLVGLVVLTLVVLSHRLYFVALPQRAIRKYKRDPERLRRAMERVVATPSLLGPSQKLVAHGALVGIHLTAGRHAEAASHAQAQLTALAGVRTRHARLDFPALEADIRRRLADCLEALGEVDEAEQERRQAEMCLKRAPDDPLRHLTRGTLLERQNRYAEAREAFEQALAITPETNRTARIECLIHLVLACFNDARPAESRARAEEAIALGAEGKHLRAAHWMAAAACGDLGRLAEAEEHVRRAYAVAEAEQDPGTMAEILGSLAGIQLKRGRLAEANEACIQAMALDPKGVRMASAVQSQVLREWGRHDDALAVLRRHDNAPGLNIPYFERRLRAASALEQARIEAECGRADDAWSHIQEARAVLRDDTKLGLLCEGALAWVYAARGLADESREAADWAKSELADFARDPQTSRSLLFDVGMAAWTRSDYKEAIDCWTRYLDLAPHPVYRPTALYVRGECCRGLGDEPGATANFRAAAAEGLDTHFSRLARRRLVESPLA
jgi:tetratricopeptide (TPR) repeat protein